MGLYWGEGIVVGESLCCISQAVTKMGQKITDLEVTDTVVSEVLRVFIKARAGNQHEVNTRPTLHNMTIVKFSPQCLHM